MKRLFIILLITTTFLIQCRRDRGPELPTIVHITAKHALTDERMEGVPFYIYESHGFPESIHTTILEFETDSLGEYTYAFDPHPYRGYHLRYDYDEYEKDSIKYTHNLPPYAYYDYYTIQKEEFNHIEILLTPNGIVKVNVTDTVPWLVSGHMIVNTSHYGSGGDEVSGNQTFYYPWTGNDSATIYWNYKDDNISNSWGTYEKDFYVKALDTVVVNIEY